MLSITSTEARINNFKKHASTLTCLELSASAMSPSTHWREFEPPRSLPERRRVLTTSPVCSTNRSTCCCVELSKKPCSTGITNKGSILELPMLYMPTSLDEKQVTSKINSKQNFNNSLTQHSISPPAVV